MVVSPEGRNIAQWGLSRSDPYEAESHGGWYLSGLTECSETVEPRRP